jgi:hypothetical protein
MPRPAAANVFPRRPHQVSSGKRRERGLFEALDVDAVRVDGAYPFEVRRDLLRGTGYSALTGL